MHIFLFGRSVCRSVGLSPGDCMVDGDHGGGRGMNIFSQLGNNESVTPTCPTNRGSESSGCLRRECEQCQPAATSPARRASTPPPLCEGKKERGRREGGETGEAGRIRGRAPRSLLPLSFHPGRQNCVSGETAASSSPARSLGSLRAWMPTEAAGRKAEEGGDL